MKMFTSTKWIIATTILITLINSMFVFGGGLGAPLSPKILNQIGDFVNMPVIPPGWSPSGNWEGVYTHYNHGGMDQPLAYQGDLKVERIRIDDNNFTLKSTDTLTDAAFFLRTWSITAEHVNDARSTLKSWSKTSSYNLLGDSVSPNCEFSETGTVSGGSLSVDIGTKTVTRPGSSQMTTDYGVLEAVQDLRFFSSTVVDLDVLEGGSRFFEGRNLAYLKSETVNLSTGSVTLYGFRELGCGGAASEYWVDEHHRVIIAVMFGNRAIILNSSTTTDTTRFFSDGFESGFANWVNFGCNNTSEKAYGDTRSCRLNGTDSILTSVSTSGKDGIIVKYRVDAKDLDNDDTLSAQWYDGNTYHDIEVIHAEGPVYPWKAREFTLPEGANNNPDFRLRFIINSVKDEAFIDSVEMRYMSDSPIPNMTPPSPPPSPPSTPTATPGGTTVTLSAIDDAYVRGDGTQDGTGPELVIKGTPNLQYVRESYIKFDAKGINGSVTSAKLRLYCTSAGADITVRKVPSDRWSETSITWANKPEVGPVQSTETTTADAYIEWDITSLVVKQLSGDGVVSLGLSDDAQTVSLVEFNTKEAGSNPPQLVIK